MPVLSLFFSFLFYLSSHRSDGHSYSVQRWLCVVPINLVGAGRECQHSLGSHWKVSLIITRQVGLGGTESVLTLILYVSACAYNFLQKICFLGTTSKRKKRRNWIFSRSFDGNIRDSIDRWSLKLVVGIREFKVQTNACMVSQWTEIIISQWGHYWQQGDPSVAPPDTPHWTKTPEWGNLHDLSLKVSMEIFIPDVFFIVSLSLYYFEKSWTHHHLPRQSWDRCFSGFNTK